MKQLMLIVPMLIACTEPNQAPPFSASVSKDKARPLTGSQERSETVRGKKFKLQMKYEDGSLVKTMLYQDTIPLVLTEYAGNTSRDTWYDSTGTPTYVSITVSKKQSLIGRCLRLLLPDVANAQSLTKCTIEYQDMAWAAVAVTAATTAAVLACTIPTSPVCIAAGLSLGAATGSYNVARTKYNMCMGSPSTVPGGGGGGGFVDNPPQTKTTTTTTNSGGCYTTETRVYSLATGYQIGPTTYATVCK